MLDGNKVRAELLKRHFLERYLPLKAQMPEPRVLLKFGGMHMGKGFSFPHQRDLGNFVAELADGEQTQSLYIIVVGVRGVHSYPAGYAKPLVPQLFVMVEDPDWRWVTPPTSQVLSQPAGSSGTMLTLFDLRQLPFRDLALPADWEHLVYSFDLLVLVPEFTAATPIR